MFAALKGFMTGAVFNPLAYSPGVWLDASDATTLYDATSGGSLVAANGEVKRWEDKSGNARHYTQGTATAIPTRRTAVANGLDVVRFDGINDFMSRATGLSLTKNIAGCTVYIVRKWATNPTSLRSYFLENVGSGGSRINIYAGVTSGKSSAGGRRLDADSFAFVTSSASVSTAAFQIHSAVYDYANSNLDQYLNAALDGTTTSFQTDGNTSNTDTALAYIGSSVASGFADIDVAEILVFPEAHDSAKRAAVHSYLAAKYAIAI